MSCISTLRKGRLKVDEAKYELNLVYKIAEIIYVENKVKVIREASDNQKSSLAWKTVNVTPGRKEFKRYWKDLPKALPKMRETKL